MYDDADLKRKAEWLAKEALQGFFGTDKHDFKDMKKGSRAAAVSNVYKALQKIFKKEGNDDGNDK